MDFIATLHLVQVEEVLLSSLPCCYSSQPICQFYQHSVTSLTRTLLMSNTSAVVFVFAIVTNLVVLSLAAEAPAAVGSLSDSRVPGGRGRGGGEEEEASFSNSSRGSRNDRADVPVLIPLLNNDENEDGDEGRMNASTMVAMMLVLTTLMMEVEVMMMRKMVVDEGYDGAEDGDGDM